MKNFAYYKAGSLAEALKALGTRGAKLHAGGTDLQGCLRGGLIEADRVVSINHLGELKGISARPDGGIKIGALTTLAEIAAHSSLAEGYSVLAQAAAEVASPQLREQGTIGGNLCQRPRCWYFRSDIQCLKKGGKVCYAVGGENQYHAIFGGGPCYFVHPSDTAVALTALDAQLLITAPSGSRAEKIEDFFINKRENIDKETVLEAGEMISEIHIPPLNGSVKSSYRKIRARGAWDFALTSVGLVLEFEDDTVRAARIVLGGVAPHPWRIEPAEQVLVGKKLNSALASEAAGAAVSGAKPLSANAYKVDMVKGAVEESIAAFI